MPEMHGDEPQLTFHSDKNSASGGVLHQLAKPSNGNGVSMVLHVQEERLLPFRASAGRRWREVVALVEEEHRDLAGLDCNFILFGFI